MSKGSKRVPRQITMAQEDFKWEYLKATPERKAEILEELQALEAPKGKW